MKAASYLRTTSNSNSTSYFPAQKSIFGKGLVFQGGPAVWGERTGRRGILPGEGSTDIDQVISDHAESYPSFHPGVSFVTASTQSVPAFEYADSSFTTSSPLLSFAEPALFLMSAPFRTLGGTIGNGKTLYAHVLNLLFSLRGVEAGVAGNHGRNPMKALLVDFYRGDQEVFIVGPLLIYVVGDDHLILGFLDFYQFAELCGFAGLAFADDLGLRFKDTSHHGVTGSSALVVG
jgi:hypothetical protein